MKLGCTIFKAHSDSPVTPQGMKPLNLRVAHRLCLGTVPLNLLSQG